MADRTARDPARPERADGQEPVDLLLSARRASAATGVAVGVDGCRGGWLFIALTPRGAEHGVVTAVDALVERFPARTPVFIDMPIGLADGGDGTRGCDTKARALLGPRRSSVFNAPVRAALAAPDYPTANAVNRDITGKGLSKQAYHIMARIDEVDSVLRGSARARGMLREAHPEVCFHALAGGRPMAHPKRTEAGFTERLAVLERAWPQARAVVADAWLTHAGNGVARDDVLDAMANALNARAGPSRWVSLPARPPRDACGLPMRIVFARTD